MLRRRAGFFAVLSTSYLLILGILLLAREFNWFSIDRLEGPVAGIVPLAVPWFESLGAVVISLYGVFDHNGKGWNTTYNYWHTLRPLMGAAWEPWHI